MRLCTYVCICMYIQYICVCVNTQQSSDDGSPSAGRMQQKRNIQIIEWEDLDKRKFYSFGVFMTMSIRVTVYPATLIRTRLQVQKGKSLYGGTFDAFFKILRSEGVRGLYRGFMVNTFTLISGQAYITTYELVRKYVSQYSEDNTVKSLVAGGSASLVAQSITVPIDVVSQQLMMQGQGQHLSRFRLNASAETAKSKKVFGQTRNIVAQIFAADGLRGFYRGYVASLLTYIPNSAVWWPFYHFYAGQWPHVLRRFLVSDVNVFVHLQKTEEFITSYSRVFTHPSGISGPVTDQGSSTQWIVNYMTSTVILTT